MLCSFGRDSQPKDVSCTSGPKPESDVSEGLSKVDSARNGNHVKISRTGNINNRDLLAPAHDTHAPSIPHIYELFQADTLPNNSKVLLLYFYTFPFP